MRRLALTTERIDATEALAIGLVQRVVPAAGLDQAIEFTVGHLSAGGPNAHREVKAHIGQRARPSRPKETIRYFAMPRNTARQHPNSISLLGSI